MQDDLLITEVRSQTIPGVPGRSVNSARTHHFVIDEPVSAGGPGEELTPAEVFLAGVAGCGVLLVESFARKDGEPIKSAHARIEGVRKKENPSDFVQINLRFEIRGVDLKQAQGLVEKFKGR